VARSYRDRLAQSDPDGCAELDAVMLQLGQRWVVPTVAVYTDDDLLTASLVADFANVSLKAVYGWCSRESDPLPSVVTPDGIRFRFADVREWLGNRA